MDCIEKYLNRHDTGPDYDHTYQLEDGREEMHYEELEKERRLCRELLEALEIAS